jgi:hypothetical protein
MNSDIDNDNDNDNYIFQANLNNKLRKELGLTENIYDEQIIYEPPKEYGLTNSDIIIASCYNLHKYPHKAFDIDYFTIIKDDIRNCKSLNKYQLEYIKQLSHEQKNELFDIFNVCIDTLNKLL